MPNMFACFGLKARHHKKLNVHTSYINDVGGTYTLDNRGSTLQRSGSLGRTPLLQKEINGNTIHSIPKKTFKEIKENYYKDKVHHLNNYDQKGGAPNGTPIPRRKKGNESTPNGTPIPRRKNSSFRRSKRSLSECETQQKNPVKILRSAAPNVVGPPSRNSAHLEQVKQLEAEVSSRTQSLKKAEEEAAKAARGVEALTVLVNYLTKEYDAFSTPQLKSEVERLCSQLNSVQLSLDESTATARRLEDEAKERTKEHEEAVSLLEVEHEKHMGSIKEEHNKQIELINEKHSLDLRDEDAKEEIKREQLIVCHKLELTRIDDDWRAQVEQQHQRHLQALQQLNEQHTKQIKDAEANWEEKEKLLQEENGRLMTQQESLTAASKKLEESLMSDKDHRLVAAKNVCSALRSEVDSLKTVVEMRNAEVHKLRNQVTDRERLIEDLQAAKDRLRSLQAKTEDLNAQMETKNSLERQLLADRAMLAANLQKESSANKKLSLENEELQWKLRQREKAMAQDNLPTSTLDLVTRCSPLPPPPQEDRGSKSGGSSPQVTPRSHRIVPKAQLLKSDYDKRWTQSFGNIPEEARKHFPKEPQGDSDSPPPSPRVKSVIEKSNSVSFILDLDDTFPDQDQHQHQQQQQQPPFLAMQSSPLLRKARQKIQRSSSSGKDRKIYIPDNKIMSKSVEDSPKRMNNKGFHRNPFSKSSFQVVPHLLQQTEEDEFEDVENEFVEVLALDGDEDLKSAPLTILFAQTPSTSVSFSDSDVSQCGSRADLSSDEESEIDDLDEDSTENDEETLGFNNGAVVLKEGQRMEILGLQEGAGEAMMIFPDSLELKQNCETPMLDSEDDADKNDSSWSEDVDFDLTSSSEVQEEL